MASEDDLFAQLIFEAPTTPAIDLMTAALAANRKQLEYVQAAMVSVNAPTAAYQARLNDLTQADIRLTKEVERLSAAELGHVKALFEENAATAQATTIQRSLAEVYSASLVKHVAIGEAGTKVRAGMEQAGRGAAGFSQSLLQLGYLADDAQYGLRGIQNNLPQLAMSFGLGMGVAGGVALAVTALAQLINHWDQLTSLFGQGATLTEAERMKALADATRRTVDEEIRLADFKRQQAAGEKLITELPKAQQEDAEKVHKALIEAGGGKLIQGFAQLQMEQAGGADALVKQTQKERDRRLGEQVKRYGLLGLVTSKEGIGTQWEMWKKAAGLETGQEQVQQHAKEIQMDYEAYAKQDLARAETDPAWRKKLVAQMKANPKYFPAGALEKLEAVSPETLTAERQAKVDEKKNKEADKFQAELLRTYQQSAQEAGRKGRINLRSEPIREFMAGTLPVEKLGEREAGIIREGGRDILGRRQPGVDDKTRQAELVEINKQILDAIKKGNQKQDNKPLAGAPPAIKRP